MLLVNVAMIAELAEESHFQAKMVFNDRGAIFLSVRDEHRFHEAAGISYEDNYKGNALAAMLGPGTIEIRYHEGFTDRRVARIVRSLLEHSRSWHLWKGGGRRTKDGR